MDKTNISHIQTLSKIGIALSLEKDINKLFKMIVEEAKNLCNADAASLYIVDEEKRYLKFVIVLNDTLDSDASEFLQLSDLPLYINGKPNHSNVSSFAALTGKAFNIPDIYQAEKNSSLKGMDFSGTCKYDKKTGYHTKSMLVIPMKNHEGTTIGVLQLLNAKDRNSGQIISFLKEDETIIASLASQAAVALDNVQLIKGLKDLLYEFLKSIATAIDGKSPYTGGHIKRVVKLAMMIADAVNSENKGIYKDMHLNDDEKEELLIAAWMHDVGKITTPEYIVDKAGKLETVFDRIKFIEMRFAWLEEKIKNQYLKRKINMLEKASPGRTDFQTSTLDRECSSLIKQLRDDLEIIRQVSTSRDFLTDDKLERIRQIAGRKYKFDNNTCNVLTESEVEHLSIRKGTLTDRERKIIEHHAKMTYMITSNLPFPKHLVHVPEYASQHHEKLDGSGYPDGIEGNDLSLQSRILAVADIFEALTARDRPYKKPMELSQAINILTLMKNDNKLDPGIVDLFIDTGLYNTYAEMYLAEDQRDI